MYANLRVNGLGGFGGGVYLSSSENDVFNAWAHRFSTGVQNRYGKDDTGTVRAVRAFSTRNIHAARAVSTVTVDNIAKKLAALPGTAPDSPATVKVKAINIRTASGKQIYTAVEDAKQYVILDLSACSATGNTVTGAEDPSDADMNVIWNNEYIKGIILPKSLTSIGDYAFVGCTSLMSVTIPNGVTSIGERAFEDCTSLTGVTIPDSVTSIGRYAFVGCTSLTSVTIPGSVTSIGSSAFYGCTSLTSVTIPGSVTSIGSRAFNSCASLTSVTFGAGSNITTAWANDMFGIGEYSYDSGKSFWTAYTGGTSKAGTYTLAGSTWTQQ
jgi:hypothetical protein